MLRTYCSALRWVEGEGCPRPTAHRPTYMVSFSRRLCILCIYQGLGRCTNCSFGVVFMIVSDTFDPQHLMQEHETTLSAIIRESDGVILNSEAMNSRKIRKREWCRKGEKNIAGVHGNSLQFTEGEELHIQDMMLWRPVALMLILSNYINFCG